MLIIDKCSDVFNEFKSFGKEVDMYILMHTIGGIFFSYNIILPVFMNKLGVTISDIGTFFSIAALADLIFTYLLRKSFDTISPNKCMALDWLTESWPVLIFALASTKMQFFIGAIAQKITNVLNPAYRVYENAIFKEDKRSKIYTYHLFIPEIATVIIFPILGYILTYKFNSILAYRIVFIIFGIGFLFVALIPYKFLKWVNPTRSKHSNTKLSISKGLYLIASAEILVVVSGELTSTFITTYFILDKIKGNLMQILLLQVLMSIVTIITGMLCKDIDKKIKNENVCQIGILTFIIYTLLMFFAKNFKVVLLANVINTIGHTLWFPSQTTILMDFIPEKERGEFFATISSISKLVYVILPVLCGFIIQSFGFGVIFSIALFMYVIIFIIYKFLIKNKEKMKNQIGLYK